MGLRDPDPPYEVARTGRDYPDTRLDGSGTTAVPIQAVPDTFSSGGEWLGEDYYVADCIRLLWILDEESTDPNRINPSRHIILRLIHQCLSDMVR